MLLKITVESTLSGLAAGYQFQTVERTATVDSIIASYCIYKGIRQNRRYVLRTSDNVVLDSLKTLVTAGVTDGDHLFLGSGDEQQTFGFNNWWILAGVALVIGTVGLIASVTAYSISSNVSVSYGVVFVAGPTHTNMAFYSWPGDKWSRTGTVQQTGQCHSKGHGISEFAANPSQVPEYLAACLKEAEQEVPAEARHRTPVYLAATGGMRLLSLASPAAAVCILAKVRGMFAVSPFRFSADMVSIIPGETEAALGWLEVNYRRHNFLQVSDAGGKRSKVKTVGALGLDAASAAISLEVADSNNSSPANLTNLRLFGKNYTVSSYSVLCFGIVEAQRRYRSQLIQNLSEAVWSPCGARGHNVTVTTEELYSSPCTQPADNISRIFLQLDTKKSITVMGTGDWRECQHQIQQLFDSSHCQQNYKFQQCFHNTRDISLTGKFVAFSTYSQIAASLGVTDNTTLQQFHNTLRRICSLPWTQLRQLPGLEEHVLESLCFSAVFMYVLLTYGYGFNSDTWENIQFIDSAASVELNWALGFMLNRTNTIPSEKPAVSINLAVFVLLLLLFSLFLVTAAVFTCHAVKLRHHSSHYQRWSSYGSLRDNLL